MLHSIGGRVREAAITRDGTVRASGGRVSAGGDAGVVGALAEGGSGEEEKSRVERTASLSKQLVTVFLHLSEPVSHLMSLHASLAGQTRAV